MNSEQGLAATVERSFDRIPGYLNTASVGLPTLQTLEVFRNRLTEWQLGRCQPASFDPDVGRGRAAYARIADVSQERVGIIGQASVATGMVAGSLPAGAKVLGAEEDFTSVLFPFLSDDRLEVRLVPLEELLESIDEQVDLVAVSAVQSADGRVIDLDALARLAAEHGTRTFVDATQGAGWLRLDAGRFDVTVCHGYKWLLAPRGAGFITVSDEAMDWLRPIDAGWYAGEMPWKSIYGPPLRLAEDARRFDVSPAWFSYAAAVPGLELLADLGPDVVGAHNIGLANEFRTRVGLDASNSAIVSVETDAGSEMASAGIIVSERAGKARMSFHLYNNLEDVEQAVALV